MRLEGRTAIITGGGRGIGRAIALVFAREGARVAVSARTSSEIEQVASEITSQGHEAIAVQADVSSETDVTRLVDDTVKRFNTVDILVNNAAVNLADRRVVDLTLQEWENAFKVNVTGTFLCCKAVLPIMIRQRRGKVINISSLGGRVGAAGRSPYRASKAALINFTESLAAEVKDYGIDVNAICPGGVDTDMMRMLMGSRGAYRGKLMRPEEIAAVAVFLASHESSAITGTAIDAFGATNPLFR